MIHGDGPFVSVPLLHTVTHSSGTAQLGSQFGSQLGSQLGDGTARGRSFCDCPLVSADVSIYLPTFQSLDRPSHEHLISAIHAAETGHSRPLFCPAEVEIIYRTIRTKLK